MLITQPGQQSTVTAPQVDHSTSVGDLAHQNVVDVFSAVVDHRHLFGTHHNISEGRSDPRWVDWKSIIANRGRTSRETNDPE